MSFDYNSFLMAHQAPETSKASRFVTMSAVIHAALILAAATLTIPLVEKAKTETITIEIEDSAMPQAQKLPSKGAPVEATQGGGGAQADDIIMPVKLSKAKGAVRASRAIKPQAKAQSKSRARTTLRAVPMTIDDIDAPELDHGALAKVSSSSSALNEDFGSDFDKLDQRNPLLDNEKKNLEAMASALQSEQDADLQALDDLNQADAKQMAQAQAALKQKNAQAIASAQASEKVAARAAAAAALAAGAGLGSKSGLGAGNNGANEKSSQLAGLPNGVRSLEQLKQMPGNPRPRYDREERRRGDQGKVIFYAYISKEGLPSKFKMIESTGFKGLDEKTLAALKKWRFYPGQEGWVELPFQWDLKGGAQEDGGLLRRSVSRR